MAAAKKPVKSQFKFEGEPMFPTAGGANLIRVTDSGNLGVGQIIDVDVKGQTHRMIYRLSTDGQGWLIEAPRITYQYSEAA